jgi:zinc protease
MTRTRSALLLALLLGLGTALFAAPVPAPPAAGNPLQAAENAEIASVASADLAAVLPVNPALVWGRLPNGLKYYVLRNTVPAGRAEMRLVVNAGSVLEDDDQRGLAHLIEHMAFNGTHDFQKQDLIKYLESIGMRFGADVNAYTDFDETVYQLTLPTDKTEYLDRGLQIMEGWAHGIVFDPVEVDKERGVVIEEWRLGRGAGARLQDKEFPVVFQGSRYAERLPIGLVPTLQKAPIAALQRFYHDWYRPDLMAVVAVGDFDPKQVETLIRDRFSKLQNPPDERPRQLFPVPEHKETLFAIATDPEQTDTTVALYSKHPRRRQDRYGDYRQSIVEVLYHGMLTARLSEIAQRPDPPFLWASSSSGALVRSSEVTLEQAGVREGETERGLQALLTEVERVHQHGFTPGELERAKMEWLRGYEQAYQERDKQESRPYAEEYIRVFLEDEPTPGIAAERALVMRFLPEIRLDEVNRLAGEWLDGDNRVVVVSAPGKPGSPPPPERARLEAVFQSVVASKIDPYVDRVVAGPLVPQPPKPGTIVSESRIPELGVTEWRLSNGVRVMLKPTDFKNDQVLLSGYSPGGHSLVSDRDYPSALVAAPMVGEGGVGSFDSVTLEKALAGKTVQLSPFITQLEEGIEGGSSAKDLDTLLQLTYLTIAEPRKDDTAFRSFLAKMRALAQNRLADPDEVFSDRMTQALTQNHPRWQPLTPELIDRVDPEAAWRIYRERFADAGDFTFLVVGSFQPEQVKPLVLTWLGGLPSQGRKETWRDIGTRTPDKVVKVDVRKGLEPKSQVQIAFTGEVPFSREARHDINALGEALQLRLHEVLREDLGAVYGVQVEGDLTHRPRDRYQITIGFGCAPDKVDTLVQAVFKEIESVQKDGVSQTIVDEVRETERRERQVGQKTNEFWVAALELYDTEGQDPREILQFDQLLNRVNSFRLREAAKRYLSEQRYVLGVLEPENAPAQQPAAALTGN